MNEIEVSKEDIDVIDGSVIINNEKVLQAIQSEQEIDLNCDREQNAFGLQVII